MELAVNAITDDFIFMVAVVTNVRKIRSVTDNEDDIPREKRNEFVRHLPRRRYGLCAECNNRILKKLSHDHVIATVGYAVVGIYCVSFNPTSMFSREYISRHVRRQG